MKQKKIHGKVFSLIFLLMLAGAVLDNIQCKRAEKQVLTVYTSSRDGDRLSKTGMSGFKEVLKAGTDVITVDDGLFYQKIDGFGATFNEAGMVCLNTLTEEKKDGVLRMLFDSVSGSGFTLMKSPVGACDYASAGPWYTYNDTPGDTSMDHFSIDRDLGPDGLITYIKSALRYGRFEIESPMDFAPDWMYFSLKNGEKHIKPQYNRALARYYSKFIKAYAEHGITINYLNLFNEGDNPHYSNVTYKAMGEMIKYYVVPQFQADGLSTKIQLGETCTRPEAFEKFPPVLNDPDVRKHITTLTSHGYDWDKHSSLASLHDLFPDIPIWQTEVCYGMDMCVPPGGLVRCPVYEFADGEFWGNMIMNDMKNWVSGWIYWNMILDQNGGPWLVSVSHGDPDPNRQHSVVIVDRNTGEVTFTGLYYYLSHFSKFVRPGATRIHCTGGSLQLNTAAFLNRDGSIVFNVINNGDDTDCNISWKNKVSELKLKAHSITTVIWNTSFSE